MIADGETVDSAHTGLLRDLSQRGQTTLIGYSAEQGCLDFDGHVDLPAMTQGSDDYRFLL
jgi:hypothetical protein